MAELLSSKITVGEEDPTIRSFPSLASAVLAIQGIAEMGPIGTWTLLTSFEEYQEIYGGYLASYQLAQAVRAFFLNGGNQCYVSRTAHYSSVSAGTLATAAKGAVTLQTTGGAATAAEVTGAVAGPWAFAPGDTLGVKIDQGGVLTATFDAAAGYQDDTTTYPVADQNGNNITVQFDGGAVQTVTFSGVTTTLVSVINQINAQIYGGFVVDQGGQVRVTSDTKGTNSTVLCGVGTSGLTFGSATAGTGDVADILSVTAAEIETVVEADVAGTVVTEEAGGFIKLATTDTGSTAYIQVDAAGSTVEAVLGLATTEFQGSDSAPQDTLTMTAKYYGAYANALKIKVTAASSAVASEFNLQVLLGTAVLESFANVTMDDTADRYVLTVVNNADVGSLRFVASDDAATGSPTVIRPADTSGATVVGGDDGLTSLDDNDFIGDPAGSTGLYAFDTADDATLLASPDRITAAVQNAMMTYCGDDRKGFMFALLDPPLGQTAAQMLTYRSTLTSTAYPEFGALYWPQVKIVNPSVSIFGTGADITVAPCGYVAGIMARNDANEQAGPFVQPAGVEEGKPSGLIGVGMDEVKLEAKRDLVFPQRINPISYLKRYGYFVDGARTLKGDGNFPSVGERRGVSHIERLLSDGLQWVRHKNNTEQLREDVETTVYAELRSWMDKGAFASNDPATAFFVDVSDALNPPSVIRAGKLVLRVGMATNTPAEFVIIKVTKDTRALNEELLG